MDYLLFILMYALAIITGPWYLSIYFIRRVKHFIRWVWFPQITASSEQESWQDRLSLWRSSKIDLPSIKSTEQLEQEITRIIPIGTPLAQAERLMKRNRFSCEHREQGTFIFSHEIQTSSLHCVRNVGRPLSLVSRNRVCDLEHSEGSTTRVVVSSWLLGP